MTRNDWFVRLVVLMPDHLHALASFPSGIDMKKVVANWKEFTAKRYSVKWQPDFFDHRLRTNEGIEEKLHYIRLNPVRAGLVDRPSEWPYVWPR